MKLRPKQALFVAEYLKDFNATQAAIRAGYSPRTATRSGYLNVRKRHVQKALERSMEARMERLHMQQDDVLNELRLLGMSDISHYQLDDLGNLELAADAPDGAMRAISGIDRTVKYDDDGNPTYTVKFRLWNKPQSLTLVGRHMGMWHDKIEHSGRIEGDLGGKSDEELRKVADELRGTSGEKG